MTNKQKEHHDLYILYTTLSLAHSLLHNHSTGITNSSYNKIHPEINRLLKIVKTLMEELEDPITVENLKEAI